MSRAWVVVGLMVHAGLTSARWTQPKMTQSDQDPAHQCLVWCI
ncbi:hypothetical protein OEZ74_27230 [Leclercia adecarboxylata]|nr:hypothetical protein [Leclercia adecarboxylata]MDC6657966.1 hypothetical protein [Leclercia adecarboxylata]